MASQPPALGYRAVASWTAVVLYRFWPQDRQNAPVNVRLRRFHGRFQSARGLAEFPLSRFSQGRNVKVMNIRSDSPLHLIFSRALVLFVLVGWTDSSLRGQTYGPRGAVACNGVDGLVSSTIYVSNPQKFTLNLWFKTASTKGGILLGFSNSQNGLGNLSRVFWPDRPDAILVQTAPGSLKLSISII